MNALDILRDMVSEELQKRAALLGPEHNYNHMQSNEPYAATLHAQRAAILEEAIRRISD